VNVEVRLPSALPDARGAYDLARALGAAACAFWPAATRVVVRVHENRSTLLKWSYPPGEVHIHCHAAFLPLPDDVIAVVARRDPAAWSRLRLLPRSRPAPDMAADGEVHHLDALIVAERARLDRELPAAVGWGRWSGVAPQRSLRLGSCAAGDPPVIRIHPVLDHEQVPAWFVGFVLYHELLHLRFPPLAEAGRRVIHPRSFRQAERRHPRYAEALAWEEAHIGHLLHRARERTGRS
jgi:hypothetical protein